MTEVVDRKYKVFFRRKGTRAWSTHVGSYSEGTARREAARLKGPSWEVKIRITEIREEMV